MSKANQPRRGGKKGRKIGRQARSPAQARYWALRKLEAHKIRNLMRHNGMTREEAAQHWRAARKTRMKPAYKA